MRVIGHLPSEATASTFSDFLLVQGIHNSIESEKDGWAVWVHSEDEVPKARELLQSFASNPNDPRYTKKAAQAATLKKAEVAQEQRAAKRYFDRSKIFKSSGPYSAGPLTLALMLSCIIVAVVGGLVKDPRNFDFLSHLFITSTLDGGLPEVSHGEIWRLITPIFMHADLLHIFFNMLWLFDLGSMIEGREHSGKLAALVFVSAALSNLAQFWLKGPSFFGMSGVVYALLGYIFVKGRMNPTSGLYLHPHTFIMMIIWLFACLFGLVGNIANGAHFAGITIGLVWGFLSALYQNRRRA
ncbi:MAG TPA: rhomboid family intramembrane serine protease [Verrucomicrobiae bacterium]|jgi:GlpG protein